MMQRTSTATVRRFRTGDGPGIARAWTAAAPGDGITYTRLRDMVLLDRNFDADGLFVAEQDGGVVGAAYGVRRRIPANGSDAHIGDMDLTAGPALATMIDDGDRAILLACTYGERGHPRLPPDEYRVQKVREGEQFADDIGAEFRVLDYSDGFLPDDDEAANQIADIIRADKPDIVITHWTRSIHRDHERAATLVVRARFLASLPVGSPLGRHGVTQLLHADNWEDAEGFVPDRYVPIPDSAFRRWRSAIQKQAFARGETYGFRYIDYYTAMMTAKGCLAGTDRACAFAVGGDLKVHVAGL